MISELYKNIANVHRDRIIEEAKIKRNATIKAWVTRRQFKRKLAAIVVFQKHFRGLKDRRYVAHLRMLRDMEVIAHICVCVRACVRVYGEFNLN